MLFAGSFDSIVVISSYSLSSYDVFHDAIQTINFCFLVRPTIIKANFTFIYIMALWNKNQLMSLFQFYSYIAGSLHVSGPQAHPQESSHSSSHNHWFSACTALAVCSVFIPHVERMHGTKGLKLWLCLFVCVGPLAQSV